MIIELDVCWHTDATRQREELGLPVVAEEYTTKKVTFYNIDAISPSEDEDKNEYFTRIHCNGDTFTIPMPYLKVKQLIEQQLRHDVKP